MNNCLGIINLDENDRKMGELVRNRPLASIPFAGRYRIIDFVLSNMTNSGVEALGIYTKNKSRSLLDHITNGKAWDLHRQRDGLKIFNFGDEEPVYDDVHNFYENIEFLKYSRKKYVLLAPSYMICNIDYNEALQQHKDSGNEITLIYKNINNANTEFIECDILNIDDQGKVLSVGENIGRVNKANISMEMYIMETSLFIEMVDKCVVNGMYRKVKKFIHSNVAALNVGTYEFKGYLACINSLSSYYNANTDLLKHKVNKEVFFDGNPIYTKGKNEAPTQYTEESSVANSIIANGCYIEGEVKNSIICREVFIAKGAKLDGCVIMQNTIIGPNTVLKGVITDKGVEIPSNEKYTGSEAWPYVMKKNKYVLK